MQSARQSGFVTVIYNNYRVFISNYHSVPRDVEFVVRKISYFANFIFLMRKKCLGAGYLL